MVKNIIFDMSEVIISGYQGVENTIEEMGITTKFEFLEKKLSTIDVFLDLMRGKLTEDEYIDVLLEGSNWHISHKELKKVLRGNLKKSVPGVVDIIKSLHGRYNLILLSDYVREWKEEVLKDWEVFNFFDDVLMSYDFGLIKGDEECFRYVLNVTGIDSSETVFIDDSSLNLESAKKVGIDTILFKDAFSLKTELKKRGINT